MLMEEELSGRKLENDFLAPPLSKRRHFIAKNLSIPFLEVETDVKSPMIMLDNADSNPHHELATSIDDIAFLVNNTNWIVVFLHIHRECNLVAHQLAGHALSMEVRHKQHFKVPDCARIAYAIDLEHMGSRSN
ncbi:uncharacterized protein [Spinacia oleracea]|uniref:RNase H type-1 domain-containing protein n=1 Tax=Spinacia oleracea TaxID=3562 RepID=A0ABM3RNN3_SPIOL|nr:uncharacterized protein LOC130470724 [Spinacia oleracea]